MNSSAATALCQPESGKKRLLISLFFHEFGIGDMDFTRLHIALDVVSQRGMVASHIQGARGALDERNATVAADGETTADGDFVVFEVGYQHLFDTAILEVVLNGVECAEDDTLDAFEIRLQTQHVKQTVDVVQRLLYLFDKEDDVMFGRKMISRTGH